MSAEDFRLRQAQIAGEAAFRVLHPAEPFDAGDPHGVGVELYRQAIHWALATHAAVQSNDKSTNGLASAVNDKGPLPALETLLTTIPRSTLRAWAQDDAQLERCVHHLRLVNYTFHTPQNEPEQRLACEDLANFFRALMLTLVPTQRAVQLAVIKRNLRLSATVGLALAVIAGSWQGLRSYKLRRDLALDATWTASSSLNPALECKSPEQECKAGKGFFFHTRQENNPWLMLDLKKDKKFSSLEIVNRKDCCQERANPLTISVSTNGKEWRVVAERQTEFSTFSPQFSEVSARYIKLQIPSSAAMLHLERVRVFP